MPFPQLTLSRGVKIGNESINIRNTMVEANRTLLLKSLSAKHYLKAIRQQDMGSFTKMKQFGT
jgi:hypothetical protein